MTSKKFDPGTTVLLLFITATAALRVILNFNYDISPLANFSPLGAMALFGGANFNKKWKAFTLPLGMLFLSDLILHQTVFKAWKWIIISRLVLYMELLF
jgi:hypothetical protein